MADLLDKFIPKTKPTNKNHIRNLNKLKALLESDLIPPPQFHMGTYATKFYAIYDDREIKLDLEPDDFSRFNLEELVQKYDDTAARHLEPHEMDKETYKSCGTVCCALGHSILAGVGARTKKLFDSWYSFGDHVYGVNGEAYEWLFSPEWANTDNTPKGAAKRIEIYLEYGIPINHYDQRDGIDKLMY